MYGTLKLETDWKKIIEKK